MTNFDRDFIEDRIQEWWSDLSCDEKIELWGFWKTKETFIEQAIEEEKKKDNK